MDWESDIRTHSFADSESDFRTPSFSDIGSPTFGLLDTAYIIFMVTETERLRLVSGKTFVFILSYSIPSGPLL